MKEYVVLALIGLVLGACGIKGPLQPPPGSALAAAPLVQTPGD